MYIALSASSTSTNSVFLVSSYCVHSTSFFTQSSPNNFVVVVVGVVVVVVMNSKSDFLFVTWLPTHVSL